MNDTFFDLSRVILPKGSEIYFNLETKNVTTCLVDFQDTTFLFDNKSAYYKFLYQPNITQQYTLRVKNNFSNFTDSVRCYIEIVDDQYPSINFKELIDSSFLNYKFFLGEVLDDYGFDKLEFVYIKNGTKKLQKSLFRYKKTILALLFLFEFDFNSLSLSPGDKITYYFNIWDNDEISGSKKTSSSKSVLLLPKRIELKKSIKQ